MVTRRMNMIVAVDSKMGIGRKNSVPWHLPKEYQHFQRQTKTTQDPNRRNAVIMGRKCWESIPEKYRPLPQRINVVLSRSIEPRIEAENDLIFTNSLEDALKILTEDEQFKDRVETIWNVGGKDVYEIGLKHPWMHKLLLTRIEGDFDADVHLPEVKWDDFEQTDEFPGAKGKVQEIDKSTGLAVEWHVESYTKKQ